MRRDRKPGPSVKPFVVHAGSSGHSGEAPDDLGEHTVALVVKQRGRGHGPRVTQCTVTREEYWAALGLPVPVDGSTEEAREAT